MNVLIVEDDFKFQDIYKEYAESLAANAIVAASLEDARKAIQMYVFDMALIDISLDMKDDENVDGLLVLEYLQKKDDGTHSIVITAHGTLKIARDAILRYGAVDAIEKKHLTIDFFENTLKEELKRGLESTRKKNNMDWCVLKPGDINFMQWENILMNVCRPGGIQPLHDLFDAIVKEFSPLIPLSSKSPMKIDVEAGICFGFFWSRRHGSVVIIVLANNESQQFAKHYLEESVSDEIGENIFDKQIRMVFARVYKVPDMIWEEFIQNAV